VRLLVLVALLVALGAVGHYGVGAQENAPVEERVATLEAQVVTLQATQGALVEAVPATQTSTVDATRVALGEERRAAGDPRDMISPPGARSRQRQASPTPAHVATEADCRGWNAWVDRMDAPHARETSLFATYEAATTPSTTDQARWASELTVLARELRASNPPPAAEAYVAAQADYFSAVAEGIKADAAVRPSGALWVEVDRLYAESARLLAQTNLACTGSP